MEPLVQVSGLSYAYPARRGSPARQALNGVSFEVPPGEAFGVLGPNGGGKSTLFRLLATALRPSPGQARLFGLDLASSAAEVRARIGVVFQSPSLDPRLTVRENMVHQGRLYGLGGSELTRRVGELLDRYRISERSEERAGTLSGGLKRRVELAKALLHRPALLLLDEPSTGLDPAARKDLWEHLLELKASAGTTVLLTTHLMDEAERCARLLILDQGSVVARGTPDSLRSEIGGDVVTIESHEPAALRAAIRERWGVEAVALEGTLRLEREKGHAFIPELVEAFPGLVRSVSLSKPTLEDVFIHHTGRRFWGEARG